MNGETCNAPDGQSCMYLGAGLGAVDEGAVELHASQTTKRNKVKTFVHDMLPNRSHGDTASTYRAGDGGQVVDVLRLAARLLVH